MKVSSLVVRSVALPLRETLVSKNASGFITWDRSMVAYLMATADDGTVGFGTSATVPGYAGMTLETIVHAIEYLSPFVVGLDPFDQEAVHQTMNNRLLGNTPAKAAIDMALHDIMGKSSGRPLNQLIGGRVREDFVTDRALQTEGRSIPEVIASAEKAVEDGYRGFEIHVGADLERNVSVVKGIRDSFADVVLVADAHCAWSVKQAVNNIKAMERYDVYFEQPTRGVEGLAEVKRSVDATITADEDCFTLDDAMRLVEARAADCLTVKIPKAGGVYPARKVVNVAEAAGIDVRIDGVPGDTMISNTAAAHLALTVPRLMPGSGVMQHRYWLKKDFSLSGGLVLRDGRVSVPDVPGIGVVPDESLLGTPAQTS